MVDIQMVISTGKQLIKTVEAILNAASVIEAGYSSDVYETILLDCFTHAQMLTLEMTKLISEEPTMNGDSVFGPGELEAKIGNVIETPIKEEMNNGT